MVAVKRCQRIEGAIQAGDKSSRSQILTSGKGLGAGFTVQEGGNHTRVYDKNGRYVSAVGRHTEIPERTVKEIEKQTGVKL